MEQGTVKNNVSESKRFSGSEHSNIENEIKRENVDKREAMEENEMMGIQENDIETGKTGKHVHFSENVSTVEGSNSVQEEQLFEEISNLDEVKELTTKWVNMDKIEVEKLEWMKDCPAPTVMEMKVWDLHYSVFVSFFLVPFILQNTLNTICLDMQPL